MCAKYRKDDDLDFLEYCAENDLKLLAHYMTHDKNGSRRFTCKLLEESEFIGNRNSSDQFRRCWHLIAGELQHFGGDTLVNFIRRSGVVYKEILTDVCGKFSVKFEKNDSTYDIESKLINKLIYESWDKMTSEQQEELLREVGLDAKNDGAMGFLALQSLIRRGGYASYYGSMLVANSYAKIFGQQLDIMVGGKLAKRMIFIADVLAVLISPSLIIPAISGPAYRVTIPSVCQIAYMRRAYAKQDRF